MLRAAISRSASTVGLSSFSLLSSFESTPLASWRARLAAIMTSSKRLSMTSRQSSTVMRAINLRAAGRPSMRGKGPEMIGQGPALRKQRKVNQSLGSQRKLFLAQQRRDQAAMAPGLGLAAQAAGGEHRAHLVHGGVELVVDDDVVELVVVRHLFACRGQAPGHDLLAVLAALAHALVQRRARGRQDEHPD